MSLKSIAEHAAHAVGAARLIRRNNRSSARILMYHRFTGSLQGLTAQCEHLARHYTPFSLNELVEAANHKQPLPHNALAITVDDGYADFRHAFPVFQDFGLKVTLYVVAGFAAGELWLWPDQLLYLLKNTARRQAAIPVPDGVVQLDLTDPSAAFDTFCQAMIRMKNSDRLNVLQSLPDLLETSLPKSVPEGFAPLSWSELRALADQGLDIGAHTITHPILSKLETDSAVQSEIAGSKARIENATGFPVRHFCYPNGKSADVNEAAATAAQKAGYQTAVLAEPGFAGPPFSLFQLKRIPVDPGYPPLYFERCVAGYRL
jgi:peptidoglycan/xylan/chitin deacetylase (PgdA/CDA1 family)